MKNSNHKSLFNLIEIFSQNIKHAAKRLDAVRHCQNHQIHDFYCETQK